MTRVYFIRHAEADNSVRDGRIRPLTEKGYADRKLVTEFLQDKNIDIIFSSPFKRAVDTIADFAEKNNLEIRIIEDFREQKSSNKFNIDGDPVIRKQMINKFLEKEWDDIRNAYEVEDNDGGEHLLNVQKRNISALDEILKCHKDKNIVIGTHGTALSVIINYYDNTYGFNDFMEMINVLPWVVRMDFAGNNCVTTEKINLQKKLVFSNNGG